MRRTLIASSFAVAALVGVAGGVTYAVDSGNGPDPAAPTTTAPGMGIFLDMGLTQEQAQCLIDNIAGVDVTDQAQMLDLVNQCGITMDQLIAIGEQMSQSDTDETTVAPGDSTTTSAATAEPVTLDAATVAAVFELLGIDPAAVDCIVAAAPTTTPGDDAQAQTVLTQCGVTPSAALEGIVALDAAAAGDATATTVAGASTTVAGAPTSEAASSPIVQMVQEQLAAQGITLTDEQASCLVDNIGDLDPNDFQSVLSVLETCGIDITDLVPSG